MDPETTAASQNEEWLNGAVSQYLAVINAAVFYDIFLRNSLFITKPRLLRESQNSLRTLIILIFYHAAVINQDHYSR